MTTLGLSAVELAQLFEQLRFGGNATLNKDGHDIQVSVERIDPATVSDHDWT
jgi:hypothetical protein